MTTDLAYSLNDLVRETLLYCRDNPSLDSAGRYVGERFPEEKRDDVILAVNEAVRIYVEHTEALITHQTLQLYENIYLYDLPEDLLRAKRVWFSDFAGYVIIPRSNLAWDSAGNIYELDGDPKRYFPELTPRDKIWVLPVPNQDGSAFSRDSMYGLLRAVRDADSGEYMPWDANRALRTIDGTYFEAVGSGHIVREVISTTGNLRVDYVRYPNTMSAANDYPDPDIPEHDHRKFPFGAAWLLLEKFGTSPEDFALADRRKAQFFDDLFSSGAERTREMFRYGFRPG